MPLPSPPDAELPVVDWFDWLGTAPRVGPYAIVTLVCNGTRDGDGDADSESRSRGWRVLNRAAFLRWSIRKREGRRPRSVLDKVALAHGLSRLAMTRLARMGWRVLDISRVSPMLRPLFTYENGHHWPRANQTLRRKDGNWSGCAAPYAAGRRSLWPAR